MRLVHTQLGMKIDENKITGIPAMKPSRIARKYLLREIFSKNGFPFQ